MLPGYALDFGGVTMCACLSFAEYNSLPLDKIDSYIACAAGNF